MSEDEERAEFRRRREQAAEALRALIFRGMVTPGEAQMPPGTLIARITEVSVLLSEVLREQVPGGISFEWAES